MQRKKKKSIKKWTIEPMKPLEIECGLSDEELVSLLSEDLIKEIEKDIESDT